MGLFDKVKKAVASTTETVMKNLDDLPDSVKDIDLQKSASILAKKGGEMLGTVKNEGTGLLNNAKELLKKQDKANAMIQAGDALKILYSLMAIDGSIADEEMDQFETIGKELDPDFAAKKEEIVSECREATAKSTDPEDYYEDLCDFAGKAIRHSQSSPEGTILPKIVLWDLIVVANSEGDYADIEKKFIRFVVRQLDIDRSIPLEMETILQAMAAVEKEEQWLKTSGRSYAEVEKHVNELADRKNAIQDGIHALILD